MKLNPNALSSRIVSAMGDINFRTGGEKLLAPIKGKAVQAGKPAPSPTKFKKSKYKGLDSKGNPIYE